MNDFKTDEFEIEDNNLHPGKDDILKYVWHELEEEKEIAIGEHLAECSACLKEAQEEMKFQFLWENWQAQTHGEIYWQAYVKKTLKKTHETSSSSVIKERLQNWLDYWKGKLGSIVQFLEKESTNQTEIITDFPCDLFAPAVDFHFAQAAPVRGTVAASNSVRICTKENIQVQLSVDDSGRSLLVKIPTDYRNPPLVILAPRKGMPRIACPEEVEGTAYYSAVFTDLPAGGGLLLFEPVQQV